MPSGKDGSHSAQSWPAGLPRVVLSPSQLCKRPLQKSFSARKPKACYNRSRWLSARSGARYHRNLAPKKTNAGRDSTSVRPLPGSALKQLNYRWYRPPAQPPATLVKSLRDFSTRWRPPFAEISVGVAAEKLMLVLTGPGSSYSPKKFSTNSAALNRFRSSGFSPRPK